jgi:hypothetical protein
MFIGRILAGRRIAVVSRKKTSGRLVCEYIRGSWRNCVCRRGCGLQVVGAGCVYRVVSGGAEE